MEGWSVRIKRHGELASLACVGLSGEHFIGQVKVASNGWNRLCGWRARGDALGVWLKPCRSVHTFGMTANIDLVWLNQGQQIVHIEINLKPSSWRYQADACSVIELPSGVLAKHGFMNKLASSCKEQM